MSADGELISTPVLRRRHFCEIRTTSSLNSPRCGRDAYELRTNLYNVSLWACRQHLYWEDPKVHHVKYPTLARQTEQGRLMTTGSMTWEP